MLPDFELVVNVGEKMNIGKKIKELRKFNGLSQKKLSEGLCTQAQISKLEKGAEIPSSDLLYSLSQRLGVDMNYFFDIKDMLRLDYVSEVHNQIRKYIRKRDYESVSQLVQTEINNPLFSDNKNRQFLQWHLGICEYYLKRNAELAINILNQAVDLTKYGNNLKEREIEILNSVAIIYYEIEEREKAARIYLELLEHLKYLPKINNPNIRIRIYYGLAKALTDLGDYKRSVVYSEMGINMCLKYETLYLLGELYYQNGDNLFNLGKRELGTKYLEKAITLFDLINNQEFVELIKREKNRLTNKS